MLPGWHFCGAGRVVRSRVNSLRAQLGAETAAERNLRCCSHGHQATQEQCQQHAMQTAAAAFTRLGWRLGRLQPCCCLAPSPETSAHETNLFKVSSTPGVREVVPLQEADRHHGGLRVERGRRRIEKALLGTAGHTHCTMFPHSATSPYAPPS